MPIELRSDLSYSLSNFYDLRVLLSKTEGKWLVSDSDEQKWQKIYQHYSDYNNVKSYDDLMVWMFICQLGPYIRDKEDDKKLDGLEKKPGSYIREYFTRQSGLRDLNAGKGFAKKPVTVKQKSFEKVAILPILIGIDSEDNAKYSKKIPGKDGNGHEIEFYQIPNTSYYGRECYRDLRGILDNIVSGNFQITAVMHNPNAITIMQKGSEGKDGSYKEYYIKIPNNISYGKVTLFSLLEEFADANEKIKTLAQKKSDSSMTQSLPSSPSSSRSSSPSPSPENPENDELDTLDELLGLEKRTDYYRYNPENPADGGPQSPTSPKLRKSPKPLNKASSRYLSHLSQLNLNSSQIMSSQRQMLEGEIKRLEEQKNTKYNLNKYREELALKSLKDFIKGNGVILQSQLCPIFHAIKNKNDGSYDLTKPLYVVCDENGRYTIGDDDSGLCQFPTKFPEAINKMFNYAVLVKHLDDKEIKSDSFLKYINDYLHKKKKEQDAKYKDKLSLSDEELKELNLSSKEIKEIKEIKELRTFAKPLQYLILQMRELSEACSKNPQLLNSPEVKAFANFFPKGEYTDVFDFAVDLLKQRLRDGTKELLEKRGNHNANPTSKDINEFTEIFMNEKVGCMTVGELALKLVLDHKLGAENNPFLLHGTDHFNPCYDEEAKMDLGGKVMDTPEFLSNILWRLQNDIHFCYNDHPVRFHSDQITGIRAPKVPKPIYSSVRREFLQISYINRLLALMEDDPENFAKKFSQFCEFRIHDQQTHIQYCELFYKKNTHLKYDQFIKDANAEHLTFLQDLQKLEFLNDLTGAKHWQSQLAVAMEKDPKKDPKKASFSDIDLKKFKEQLLKLKAKKIKDIPQESEDEERRFHDLHSSPHIS